jgi:hypothetical protein
MRVLIPLLTLFLMSCSSLRGYEPQEGDIIFQSLPHNDLVDAIEGVSGSPFSHCGILVSPARSGNSEWMVLESIENVHLTPLDEWIARGREGHFAAYRFKWAYQSRSGKLAAEAWAFMGLPYDFHYAMDDEAIYCSELIWKAHVAATGEPLGDLRKLGEMNWRPHERVIRRLENGEPPLDREMITPGDLADAEAMERVFAYGF